MCQYTNIGIYTHICILEPLHIHTYIHIHIILYARVRMRLAASLFVRAHHSAVNIIEINQQSSEY